MQKLVGYFDASGTHEGSNNVTLAGWVSTPEAWAHFESEWSAELANQGVPMFHMSEYAHKLGPFKQWTETQRRIRFARLAKLITDHTLASLAVAVPTSEFEKEFTAAARAHAGGAYGFAANVLLLQAPEFIEQQLTPAGTPFEIDYVFETGDVGRGQVEKLFRYNQMNPEQAALLHVGGLRFEDKRKFGSLQAADILAYELYQHFPRQHGLDDRLPRRYNLNQLAANRSWDWRYVSGDRMREDWARVIDLAAKIAEVEPWPRKPLPDNWTWPLTPEAGRPVRNLAIRPNKSRSRRESRRGH